MYCIQNPTFLIISIWMCHVISKKLKWSRSISLIKTMHVHHISVCQFSYVQPMPLYKYTSLERPVSETIWISHIWKIRTTQSINPSIFSATKQIKVRSNKTQDQEGTYKFRNRTKFLILIFKPDHDLKKKNSFLTILNKWILSLKKINNAGNNKKVTNFKVIQGGAFIKN